MKSRSLAALCTLGLGLVAGPASDDVLSWIMRVGLVDLCDHGLKAW